jgi:DNA-binding CsgD family transcriptional regulator
MSQALCGESVDEPFTVRGIAEAVEAVVDGLDASRAATPVIVDCGVDPSCLPVSATIAVDEYARSVLYNGLRHYDAARSAARRACSLEGFLLLDAALAELVEASVRCNRRDDALQALRRLVARTTPTGSYWATGITACARALVGAAAGERGVEADFAVGIDRLSAADADVAAARARLLYGEWLRRQQRRIDARSQLARALAVFERVAMHGFAERARRELLATAETGRRRTDDTRLGLTAQEAHIADLAAEGRTNIEIGQVVFLSPRTVEWHLRSVFRKLGITSRRDLRRLAATHDPV